MAKKNKVVQHEDKRTYLTDNSSAYINRTSREYSIYTLERHIVGIDGLKAAQRKAIFALSKVNGKIKTMSLSGKMIEMEIYVHGDGSASNTISALASPVSNNYPLIEGIGSFGNISSPEPAAARYTYVKKSNITEALILPDIDIVPMKENYDGSTFEPKHYLPLIPLSLLGTSGMSVGYRPNVLPRNIYDIIDNTINCISSKKMKEMLPYYKSYGSRDYAELLEESKYIVYGKADVIDASTIKITGLPPNTSREKFVEKLIEMQDKGDIRDYDDASTSIIDITVKLPRGTSATWKEDDVLSFFKLNNKLTEALIVQDEFDKVKVYTDANQIIRDYVQFRFQFYVKRYEKKLQDVQAELRYKALIQECFNNDMISKVKSFQNRAEIVQFIQGLNGEIEATDENVQSIVNFPSYRWTQESYQKVQADIQECLNLLDKYNDLLENHDKIWDIYKQELQELRKIDFNK